MDHCLPEYDVGGEVAQRTHRHGVGMGRLHGEDDARGAGTGGEDPQLPDASGPIATVYDYKPAPLRWPFLSTLTLIIVAFLALTQYACRALPLEGDRSNTWETTDNVSQIRPTSPVVPTSSSALGGSARMRRDDPPFPQNATGTVDRATITPSSRRPSLPGGNRGPKTATDIDPGDWATDGPHTITSTSPVLDGNGGTAAGDGRSVVVVSAATPIHRVVSMKTGVVTLKGATSTIVVTAVLDGATLTSTRTTVLGGPLSTFTSTEIWQGTFEPADLAPLLVTLTDSDGSATATRTRPPAVPWPFTPTVLTLKDGNGLATATVTTSVPAVSITLAWTNAAGEPTTTVARFPTTPPDMAGTPDEPGRRLIVSVYVISRLEYFVGFFVPPLLSVCLTILVRILDLNVKQFQPFHELTAPGGAPASASLCLPTTGFPGVVASLRSLFAGKALVFLTTAMLLCSAFLVPTSSETVALKLHGRCATNSFRGCAMTLGVFPEPAKATTALLGVLGGLVLVVTASLTRWRTGVASNPWSIAGMASLSADEELRSLLAMASRGDSEPILNGQLAASFGPRKFRLALRRRGSVAAYGIIIHQDDTKLEQACRVVRPGELPLAAARTATTNPNRRGILGRRKTVAARRTTKKHLPFLLLSRIVRGVVLLLLLVLIVVVAYYNSTQDDTPFETFMDNQSFGVRFLFTTVGICITFFWSSFFTSTSPAPQRSSRTAFVANSRGQTSRH